MEKKSLETQQIADEQLDDVVGGTRILSACTDGDANVVVDADADDDAKVDLLSPWIVMCPNCGHTLRYCKCAR